jgi:hypothetical protein
MGGYWDIGYWDLQMEGLIRITEQKNKEFRVRKENKSQQTVTTNYKPPTKNPNS